jgi:hypothetical protein
MARSICWSYLLLMGLQPACPAEGLWDLDRDHSLPGRTLFEMGGTVDRDGCVFSRRMAKRITLLCSFAASMEPVPTIYAKYAEDQALGGSFHVEH